MKVIIGLLFVRNLRRAVPVECILRIVCKPCFSERFLTGSLDELIFQEDKK